jgi:SAM-dependent methyltransferase
MMADLQKRTCLDFTRFTFIDLGSGKGRTLLMASDYPFRRIIGVELLPALNAIAQQNVRQYKSKSQKCFDLESICADATRIDLPEDPLVIFLFNPFPEAPLAEAVNNINKSLRGKDRPVFVLYHNPEHENVLLSCESLEKLCGAHQYSIFRNPLTASQSS